MKPSENADIWVSVQIVCHNDGKWLPRCLESLRKQTIYEQMEVILADNDSQDGTDRLAEELIRGWPNARLIRTGGDNGFCVAHNRASDVARGKYLYLFSTDTWLEPDCLEQLYRACEQNRADGAGAQILEYQDNSIQAKGSHGFDIFGNPVSLPHTCTPAPMFCIAGFYFIRRDTYFRIGRLDEKFFIYGEEMDLSWRIWTTGGLLIPVMEAKVHHRGAAGVNPAGGVNAVENRTSVQKRFLANRNNLLIISKNCRHVLLVLLLPMCGLLMFAEALATIIMTRSTQLARETCWRAFTSYLSLLKHVLAERKRLRALRTRGDFWMLRFLKFGFGRSHEIKAILSKGFPKFSR